MKSLTKEQRLMLLAKWATQHGYNRKNGTAPLKNCFPFLFNFIKLKKRRTGIGFFQNSAHFVSAFCVGCCPGLLACLICLVLLSCDMLHLVVKDAKWKSCSGLDSFCFDSPCPKLAEHSKSIKLESRPRVLIIADENTYHLLLVGVCPESAMISWMVRQRMSRRKLAAEATTRRKRCKWMAGKKEKGALNGNSGKCSCKVSRVLKEANWTKLFLW